MSASETPLVLVTGATGYVGGRLVPRLLEAGYRVRCLVRDPGRLRGRPWSGQVELVSADLLRPQSLAGAFTAVSAAYYLVHSMRHHRDFGRCDLAAARAFGQAAREAGVARIVYLGGLGRAGDELSSHLRSRHATGEALRGSGVPVTEFRAGMVVGAGSASFEMLRHLTERLPVMIGPRWVFTRSQPIAIDDVLGYLVRCLRHDATVGRVLEIGGADVLPYAEMIRRYARARDLRRWLIPVPVLTPSLSSHWVHWTTPIPSSMARPLVEGLRNELVADDRLARELFPEIRPQGFDRAVQAALAELDAGRIETSWSDALVTSARHRPVELAAREGMIMERRERLVAAPPEGVFAAFAGLGGARGWAWNWAWRARGIIDRLLGGVGLRRGRRDPDQVRPGDAIDFWRVESVEPGRTLLLRAEMKLPGRAWLEFQALPGERQTRLVQTAFFAPKGLSGLLYWYALYPLHRLIFGALIRRVAAHTRVSTVATPVL